VKHNEEEEFSQQDLLQLEQALQFDDLLTPVVEINDENSKTEMKCDFLSDLESMSLSICSARPCDDFIF
jgi:hypothetical protein